jgi:hypothetical protein
LKVFQAFVPVESNKNLCHFFIGDPMALIKKVNRNHLKKKTDGYHPSLPEISKSQTTAFSIEKRFIKIKECSYVQ